ncbi:class II aldolase/adducin family protein [Klenkia brasiliensis]|uniref:Class II Aldolase and Adducin N-terminal domain-containing protein n=1 Tax=Klenkia brasiliensis TaxID=333142 RepID=A0A1G7UUN6_9ACTN|nr:class II aldolase/adducin family protein [Klenkia brasiliensis]SDG51243.1 Class II Aldolase and Adducin N-terminal domain-containing protein [Klenkia brasiliensis]
MTATWDPSLVGPDLVQLTRDLGEPGRDLVILAEGNTSARLPDGRVVVKASGSSMRTATAEDFVVVDVDPLVELVRDPRSTQADLTAALDAGEHDGRRRRASIETLVHVAAQAFAPVPFVAHTHPTAVVGLLASVHAATAWDRHVYSDEAVVIGRPLFVPYAQPGVKLGRVYLEGLTRHWETWGELPQLVLLGNHGIVAHAPSAAGVEGVSQMAVKGALVRSAAYAAGGVAPLPTESVDEFFARDDIEERRRSLAGGTA